MKRWKNQLRKAPLDFKDTTYVTPGNPSRDEDMYLDRLRGVKPLKNRDTEGQIQGRMPTPAKGFGELSEEDQQTGVNIARDWAQKTKQALENYKAAVGERGIIFGRGNYNDDTGSVKAYNDLMRMARSIEENYKSKPFYKRIFGRGKEYRNIVKQINVIGEQMNFAFANYKQDLKQAETDSERMILQTKAKQSLQASMKTLDNVKAELDSFAQNPNKE